MTPNYVSIDWGGTSLKGICLSGTRVSEIFELPSGNIRTLSDKEMINICQELYELVRQIYPPPYKWLIGASGAGSQSIASLVKKGINMATGFTQDIEVYPDFLCNHAACLSGADGILSVNGTGSILFGVNGEKNIRLGGWGYLFDKEPSGAYFGKKYIEAVLMGYEGNPGFEYYSEKYVGPNGEKAIRHEILNQIYTSPSIPNYLGKYAIRLTDAYDCGEPYAIKTIQESIEKLSNSIAYLALKLGLSKVKFAGSGGLWDNWPNFKNLILTSCQKKGLQLEWHDKSMPLVYGPMYYYSRSK